MRKFAHMRNLNSCLWATKVFGRDSQSALRPFSDGDFTLLIYYNIYLQIYQLDKVKTKREWGVNMPNGITAEFNLNILNFDRIT